MGRAKGISQVGIKRTTPRFEERSENRQIRKSLKQGRKAVLAGVDSFLKENPSLVHNPEKCSSRFQELSSSLKTATPEQLGHMIALANIAFSEHMNPVAIFPDKPSPSSALQVTQAFYKKDGEGNIKVVSYEFTTLFKILGNIEANDVKETNNNLSAGENYQLGLEKSIDIKDFNKAGGVSSHSKFGLYRQPKIGSEINVDLNMLELELDNWEDPDLCKKLEWTKNLKGSALKMKVTGYGTQNSSGAFPFKEETNEIAYPLLTDQDGLAVVDDGFAVRVESAELGVLPGIPMWATGYGEINAIVSKLNLGEMLNKKEEARLGETKMTNIK